jgi:sugar lactone lactonase YvrE
MRSNTQHDGTCSSRRVFSHIDIPEFGEPDGLCMDSGGGIWSARWQAGKVIRLSPTGVVDVVIEFPTAWHITCVVFGGVSS